MITRESIDQIQRAVEISDVISDFVTLKKKGKDLTACCPFHDEKTPSFYVSPVKGIFKCFGCGKGGDAITFVMEHEKLSYYEALQYLANKYGIEVEYDNKNIDEVRKETDRRESILIALDFASKYYSEQLLSTDNGKALALSYFKERAFSDAIIKKFELGYSPDDRLEKAIFTKHALKNGFSEEILEAAGLLSIKEDGTKNDRFRGRAMFPIHNQLGKVIGFGARILSGDKNQPKYLNSPETEVYHKSEVLYGIHLAKKTIKDKNNAYLTEGYTDVMAMHQAGIENVVASSGTSLTEDQIKLLKRYCDTVTVLYDGDNAGIKASLRGIDMLLKSGLNVYALTLPDGDDPDSYLRKNPSFKFEEYLNEHKVDFIRFKLSLFTDELEADPFRKANVVKDIMESISLVPDTIKQSVMIKTTSALLEVEEAVLVAELRQLSIKHSEEDRRAAQRSNQAPERIKADTPALNLNEVGLSDQTFRNSTRTLESLQLQEQEAIRLLLNYADRLLEEDKKLITYHLEELEGLNFSHPLYNRILDIFRSEVKTGHIPGVNYFRSIDDREIQEFALGLLLERYLPSENWRTLHGVFVPTEEDIIPQTAFNNLVYLKLWMVNLEIEKVMNEISREQDDLKMNELLTMLTELKKIQMALTSSKEIVISGFRQVGNVKKPL